MNLIIAIIYSVVTIVLSIFIIYRFKISKSKDTGGTGLVYTGLILLFLTSLVYLAKQHPDYTLWFLPGVYPVISVGIAVSFICGLLLFIIGLSLHFSYWDDRDIVISGQLDKLRLLDDLQQESRQPYPVLELLDRVLKGILGGLGEEAGAIFLLNRSQRKFILATGVGLSKEETALLEYYPYERNIVSQAIEEQSPLISSDFRSLGGKAQLAVSRFHSILVVPLISGRNKQGAFLLFSQEEKHFSREFISILTPITEWLSEKIEVNRLSRDLNRSKEELEIKSQRFSDQSRKLEQVIKMDSGIPTPLEFAQKCIGLAGSDEAWLIGLANGRLTFYGGTPSDSGFSDNLKTALVNALGRKKAVIINQESTDESGNNFISKSSLLIPAGSNNAVLLRKSDGVISVSNEEFSLMELVASVGNLIIANSAIRTVSHSRSSGIKLISEILQIKITKTRHDKILKTFIAQIMGTFPEDFLMLLFRRERDCYKLSYSSVDDKNPENISISAGEGSTGKTAVLKIESAFYDSKSVQENLAEYHETNRENIAAIFGERNLPSFQADYPVIVKDQTVFVVSVFGFDKSSSENLEQHRLMSLLIGLLNLRFEIAFSEKAETKIKLPKEPETLKAEQINEINNSLSAISGYCQLAKADPNLSGKSLSTFNSILKTIDETARMTKGFAADKKGVKDSLSNRTNLSNIIRDIFKENEISGDLHMVEDRPLTVNLKLHNTPDINSESEKTERVLKLACSLFVKNIDDNEILSIGTYFSEGYVYVDMSKHRENFPSVEPVVGFGRYSPSEILDERVENQELARLLEGLSGEFAFDRHNDRPSYFSIKLPLEKRRTFESPVASGAGVSVLAVDDQAVILDLLEAMCQSMGYKIYTARNGEEGLNIFKAFRPDIVISDLAMPVMSGWELASNIKAISPETPIIIITGWEVSVDEARMKQIGVDHILHKPFQLEQLSDLITKISLSRIKF